MRLNVPLVELSSTAKQYVHAPSHDVTDGPTSNPADCKWLQCTCTLHLNNHTKLDTKLEGVRAAIETDCAAQIQIYTSHLPSAYVGIQLLICHSTTAAHLALDYKTRYCPWL